MSKILDRHLLFLLSGRIIQSLLAVITIRVMTELMSTQEVGHQYLINSVILWFSLVLINPIGMFVNRHLHEWKKTKQIYTFIKQINTYFFIMALTSMPVIFVVKNAFDVGAMLPTFEIVLFVFMYLYLSTWFQTLNSFFNFFEMNKIFVTINIFTQSAGLIIASALVWFFNPTALLWMTGLLIGQSLGLIIAIHQFYSKLKPKEFSEDNSSGGLFQKSTLLFCYPIAIATFFMWFLNQGYRLIIEKNLGPEVLASFGVGLGLAASIAGVVESVTTQYFLPKYYAALPDSDEKARLAAWSSLWKNSIAIYIPSCFLIIATAFFVIRILTSKNFHHVAVFMYYGACIELFRQLSNVIYLAFHGEKKTKHTIGSYFIGALFLASLFCYFFYFNELNVNTVLSSLLLAAIATCLASIHMGKKLLKLKFEYKTPMRAILFSAPLLGLTWVLNVNDSLKLLALSSVIAGIWCAGVIYFLLKKV